MGFLQGIIADARPAVSTAVSDVSRPVIAERSDKMSLPLPGGIEYNEAGMQEAYTLGVGDHGVGFSQADRQSPTVPIPNNDTGYSSTHDSITTESLAPVSDKKDGQQREASSTNVEYQEVDLQAGYPAEAVVNPEVAPSAKSYREPSVFSVMSEEVHDVFQNDSLSSDAPLLSGHEQTHFNRAAHEEIISESLSHADGADNLGTEPVSSSSAQPFVAEHTITPDKHVLPGTHVESVEASSAPLTKARLTDPDSTQEEKLHSPLFGNREVEHSGEHTSSDDLSQPTSGKTEISLSTALSRRSTLPDENKQISPDHETTEVSVVQRSAAQPKATERKSSNNNTSPLEANRRERQAAITTNSQRTAFQTEALVSSHIRQQPARKPDSPFIPPAPVQKTPEVKIGQVDVFIEAPQKETGSTKRTHKISQVFSSRHYLRRI